jgi:hypothetical protein
MNFRDEIVEEVRNAREAYTSQFDYDLRRIFEDLKEKELKERAKLADLKPLAPREQRV